MWDEQLKIWDEVGFIGDLSMKTLCFSVQLRAVKK